MAASSALQEVLQLFAAFGATAKFAAAGACWRCNALSIDGFKERRSLICPAQKRLARSGRWRAALPLGEASKSKQATSAIGACAEHEQGTLIA
eukprot:5665-Heterococcus_DN1.PRE.1